MTDPIPGMRASDVAPTPGDPFARIRIGRFVLWPAAAVAAVALITFSTPIGSQGGITGGAYAFYIALFFAALRSCRDAGVRLRDIVGPAPDDSNAWGTSAVLAPLLLTFSAMCAWLTLALAGRVAPGWASRQLAERQGDSLLAGFGPVEVTLLSLVIAFIGPFVEELVFRGILLRKWSARRGVRFGILSSAALFAVLHPHMSVGAFAFGIVLAIIYLSTGSLMPAVLVHVLNNGVVTLVSLRGAANTADASTPESLGSVQAMWAVPAVMALLSALAIAALTYPLYRRMQRRPGGAGADLLVEHS